MASSKTVFRPRWVRAEHSRYFTESEVRQQENRGLGQGRVLGKTPPNTYNCPRLRGHLGCLSEQGFTSLCLFSRGWGGEPGVSVRG